MKFLKHMAIFLLPFEVSEQGIIYLVLWNQIDMI